MKISREQVSKCYDELERRIKMDVAELHLTRRQMRDERIDMTQGLYGTLMALADNWPEVVGWTEEEEEKRSWNENPFDVYC